MCQDVSPPHHPCCYYHFGNQVCPVHAHFPPSQPEWRKQLRGGGGLGGGKLAAAAGRRVARWPAACTCCRKNNTVLCFPQTLSARLRSVVIPPSSGCAGRGGAGRLCRCDPPEMCLELRTRWMAVLPPLLPGAGPAALLSLCPLPGSASRDRSCITLYHILLIVRVLATRRPSPDKRDFCPVGGFW